MNTKSDENKKNKEEWIQKMKREGKLNRNPTQDHEAGLKALQNPTRRQILNMLARSPMEEDDIKEELKIDTMQTRFHLGMLESSLFIEKVTKDNIVVYQLSPRGEGYVENVMMENKDG